MQECTAEEGAEEAPLEAVGRGGMSIRVNYMRPWGCVIRLLSTVFIVLWLLAAVSFEQKNGLASHVLTHTRLFRNDLPFECMPPQSDLFSDDYHSNKIIVHDRKKLTSLMCLFATHFTYLNSQSNVCLLLLLG